MEWSHNEMPYMEMPPIEIRPEKDLFMNLSNKSTSLEDTSPVQMGSTDTSKDMPTKEDRVHMCIECRKIFTTSNALDKHMKLHPDQGAHVCPSCKRRFPRHSELLQHMVCHFEEIQLMCDHCDKGFPSLTALIEHVLTHARKDEVASDLKIYVPGEQEREFSLCTDCKHVFSDCTALKQHVCSKTTGGAYICLRCKAGFRGARFLKEHLIKTGDKFNVCPYRDEVVSDGQCLKEFVMEHLEENSEHLMSAKKSQNPNNPLVNHAGNGSTTRNQKKMSRNDESRSVQKHQNNEMSPAFEAGEILDSDKEVELNTKTSHMKTSLKASSRGAKLLPQIFKEDMQSQNMEHPEPIHTNMEQSQQKSIRKLPPPPPPSPPSPPQTIGQIKPIRKCLLLPHTLLLSDSNSTSLLKPQTFGLSPACEAGEILDSDKEVELNTGTSQIKTSLDATSRRAKLPPQIFKEDMQSQTMEQPEPSHTNVERPQGKSIRKLPSPPRPSPPRPSPPQTIGQITRIRKSLLMPRTLLLSESNSNSTSLLKPQTFGQSPAGEAGEILGSDKEVELNTETSHINTSLNATSCGAKLPPQIKPIGKSLQLPSLLSESNRTSLLQTQTFGQFQPNNTNDLFQTPSQPEACSTSVLFVPYFGNFQTSSGNQLALYTSGQPQPYSTNVLSIQPLQIQLNTGNVIALQPLGQAQSENTNVSSQTFAHPFPNISDGSSLMTKNQPQVKNWKGYILKCPMCNYVFVSQSDVRQHIFQNHVVDTSRHCLLCKQDFLRKSDKILHMFTNHNIHSEFVCPVCRCEVSDESTLWEHITTHSVKVSVPGTSVQKTRDEIEKTSFTRKVEQVNCIRTLGSVHSQRTYQTKHPKPQAHEYLNVCIECGEEFRDSLHLYEHEKPQKYQCPLCSKILKSRCLLQKHMKSHIKPKSKTQTKTCLECGNDLPTSQIIHVCRKNIPEKLAICPRTSKRDIILSESTNATKVSKEPFVEYPNLHPSLIEKCNKRGPLQEYKSAAGKKKACLECGNELPMGQILHVCRKNIPDNLIMHPIKEESVSQVSERRTNITEACITESPYSSCTLCVHGFTHLTDLQDHLYTHQCKCEC